MGLFLLLRVLMRYCFSNIDGKEEDHNPVIKTLFFPYCGIPIISILIPATIVEGSIIIHKIL